MIIGIDFDGTIVEHEYPKVGVDIPFAIDTLKELQHNGHQLILWTMRSDNFLQEAVDHCKSKGIEFFGVNENKEQKEWTNSPKAYCQLYIDDAALGCPLIYPTDFNRRPFVDWAEVRKILVELKLITR